MHTLAVCGSDIPSMNPDNPTLGTVEIAGRQVIAGIMSQPDPAFDPAAPEQRTSVLVQTAAFSCNYRDKALVLRGASGLPPDRFYSIGSEFVGEVIAAGDDVDDLDVGDRVIPDGTWPGHDGMPGGLPTNNSSRSVQAYDQRKLLRIPDAMSDEVAAAFTIGGQTSYSLVRKIGIDAGSNVLVTAARSNTSLFVFNALRQVGCTVYAVGTTDRSVDELGALGVSEHFTVDAALPTFMDHPQLWSLTRRIGGFDAVVDPFFDVNLAKVLPLMRSGGRYVTCGLADQYGDLIDDDVPNVGTTSMRDVMGLAMRSNLHLIGNCLGTRHDLERAVADYVAGRIDVRIDSVYGGGDASGFLDRTYNAPDRFGKVVYLHADEALPTRRTRPPAAGSQTT